MKNKKGSATNNQLYGMIIGFLAIIVALSLIPAIADYVGQSTNTVNSINTTYTSPANGATIDLVGQELITTPIVINRTDGVVINAGNYTIAEGISTTTGLKRIRYTTVGTEFDNVGVNVSYEYGAEGYIDSAGGRSLASLIVIFAALVAATAALIIAWNKDLFKELMGR